MNGRRVLEPRDLLDRILYVGISMTGPTTASFCVRHEDLLVAGVIVSLWSMVTTFYTIEWAIASYRKWRRG